MSSGVTAGATLPATGRAIFFPATCPLALLIEDAEEREGHDGRGGQRPGDVQDTPHDLVLARLALIDAGEQSTGELIRKVGSGIGVGGDNVPGDFEECQALSALGTVQSMGSQFGGQRGGKLTVQVCVKQFACFFTTHRLDPHGPAVRSVSPDLVLPSLVHVSSREIAELRNVSFGHHGLEHGAEAGPRTMQVALHRGDGKAEHVSDAVTAFVMPIKQEYGRFLRSAERIDCGPHLFLEPGNLLGLQGFGRCVRPAYGQGGEVHLTGDRFAAAQPVEADPITDREQPRAEPVAIGERFERSERFEERVLADLLGVVVVVDHSPDECEETVLVSVDDVAHGATITLSSARDEATLFLLAGC